MGRHAKITNLDTGDLRAELERREAIIQAEPWIADAVQSNGTRRKPSVRRGTRRAKRANYFKSLPKGKFTIDDLAKKAKIGKTTASVWLSVNAAAKQHVKRVSRGVYTKK